MAAVDCMSLFENWFVTLLASGQRIPLNGDVVSSLCVKQAVAAHLGLIEHDDYIYIYSRDQDGQMHMLEYSRSVCPSDSHLYAVVTEKPHIEVIPLPPRFNSAYRWRSSIGRGIQSPDGCVYWPPLDEEYGLRLTPSGNVECYCGGGLGIDVFMHAEAYIVGGLLPCTDDIYFAPYESDQVLRIKPGGNTSLVGPRIAGESRYSAEPTVGLDGSLFFPPYRCDELLRITPDGTVTLIRMPDWIAGGGSVQYYVAKGVMSPNGSIYFAPKQVGALMIVRPDGAVEFQRLDIDVRRTCFKVGGFSSYDNCVYFAGTNILRITMGGRVSVIKEEPEPVWFTPQFRCEPFQMDDGTLVFPPGGLRHFLRVGDGIQTRYEGRNLVYRYAFFAPGDGSLVLVHETEPGAMIMEHHRKDGAVGEISLTPFGPLHGPDRCMYAWLSPPTICDDCVIFAPQQGDYFVRVHF